MNKKILFVTFSILMSFSSAIAQIVSSDTRNTNYLPEERNSGVYFDFKTNNTDGLADSNTYHGVMTFRPYGGTTDFSGGLAHQLAFTDTGNMWLRSGSYTTWSTWTKIYNDKNLNRSDIDLNAKDVYANGNLWAKEIRVSLTNPWPDYVFSESYELPTLDEVEKQIAEKGHLANIPSEEEVSKKGINVGEISTKLLQKIEELTLYLIEQEKKNLKQSKEIEVLNHRLSKLEESSSKKSN